MNARSIFAALFGVTFTLLFTALPVQAGIIAAKFDLEAIRDIPSLETRVIQDWKPAPKEPGIRQKLVEITVCEWWPGQKVRLPVTLNAPATGGPVRNVIIGNMGLALKPALPSGAMLRLLKEQRVGVVLVGMSTIDAMQPAGKLHIGMKEHLLATKDTRYTQAWIWGMSDMRGLTAAIAEKDVFQPEKVIATGGSKRGVASAVAGIHDDRFTAIMPVVAPPLGNPGGAYVIGTDEPEIITANEQFLADLASGKMPSLPDTALKAIKDRDERRANERLTLEQARAAGWSKAEIAAINSQAWDICRTTSFLPALRKRGLEVFYNVGANDSVSPALVELGKRFPDFPIYIVPGGQHGGPKDSGFTRQVPTQKEVEDNLHNFAMHHFFDARPLVAAPKIATKWNSKTRVVTVTITFRDGTEPQRNEVSWAINRHAPYTLAFEYDRWETSPLKADGKGRFTATIALPAGAKSVELLSTHTHTVKELPLSVSSPLVRAQLR